jgi:NADH dehydrogenase (ubiquinone) 1 beta subcomplex subunit 7
MKATQKQMADARIPLEYRDYCAHLLIPLNKCRGETFYLPWKCENERHSYEKCQYEEYVTDIREWFPEWNGAGLLVYYQCCYTLKSIYNEPRRASYPPYTDV